jgi:hypothetical protein
MTRDPLGVLEVTIHKARLIVYTEPIAGEMNAQIEIEVEGAKKRT